MNTETTTEKNNAPKLLYQTPLFTRILLLVIIAFCSAMTALAPDLVTAALCSACAAGVFALYYLLTFQPAVVLVVVVSFVSVLLSGKDYLTAISVLLFLPAGAVLAICMCKRVSKTTAVISTAAALGVSAAVLFLIRYMAQNGTIAPTALLASYEEVFARLHTVMLETVTQTIQNSAQSNAALTSYFTDTVIMTLVDATVDSLKLSMPAITVVILELFGYLAVSLYQLLTKLLRCPLLVPREFRITMTRTSAIVFMVAYLINLFSSGNTVSVMHIAAANLAVILMPGLFLMGLRSLRRRAISPLRRRSFIITIVILGLLLFTYPVYAILFIILDGLGEVFFGDKLLF